MTTPFLISDLQRDEAFRAKPYPDTKGVWTNGYGNTHGVGPDTPPVTMAAAMTQLALNVGDAVRELDRLVPWWRDAMNDVRQDVLVEMTFNMGIEHLVGFHHMLAAIQDGDFVQAAGQMLLSQWAQDPPVGVGKRAERLADLMRDGVRP